MSYTKIFLFFFITIFLCIGNFSDSYAISKKEIRKDKIISKELDYIPEGIKPGDKPITLNESLLREFFPELKNPRLMSFDDLNDSNEKDSFIEGGYTFVLRGDFNNDNLADIAFVGKYNNYEKPDQNAFIGILSIKGKKVTREFFSRLGYGKASLMKISKYKGIPNAIGIIYTINSDYCEYLFWHKNSYRFEPCRSTH